MTSNLVFDLDLDAGVRLAQVVIGYVASACGVPEKRLTFLRRDDLARLEGLAAGKTIAEIASLSDCGFVQGDVPATSQALR
jgi:hypothetical protein